MITSIEVDGFKTLSNFRLDLNPGLNILVGPNGSGKTNIIAFFEFLTKLLENDASDATSHLGGAGAVFRRVKDTYEAQIHARVTGCYPIDTTDRWQFSAPPKSKEKFALYDFEFTLLFSNDLELVVVSSQSLKYRHSPKFLTAIPRSGREDSSWDISMNTSLDGVEMQRKVEILRMEGTGGRVFPFRNTKKNEAGEMEGDAKDFFAKVISPGTCLPTLFARFNPWLIPLTEDMASGQSFNIIPSRVKLPEDSSRRPGIASDGSGLSATLYSLKRRNVQQSFRPWPIMLASREGIKTPTLESLKAYFQLANTSIQDVSVENDPFNNQLRVSFVMKNGDYIASIPLSLMSDGTLKWLTLLTAALTASSVFSIEEPENYLHPQVQGQFVNIMRTILFEEKNASCTVMTTHSETLLNHCKPSEIVVIALRDGRTTARRCENEVELSEEIEKTGFGLGYYYIAGAL